MHITITQENLHRGLATVGRVVGNRVSLPVLANVLLRTDSGRLKIMATDLEIGVTTTIGAKVDKEGAITVPSRTLLEFSSAIAGGTVTLATSGTTLSVAGQGMKATLHGIDAEEFPLIPTVDMKRSFSVPGPEFLQALRQVVIAVAPDDTRPVLAGVLLRCQGKRLVCVATDSYRLAEKVITLDQAVDTDQEAIIPARAINELIRALSANTADQVVIAVQDNQILFAFAETELVSRIIDGKYPDYEKIIPSTTTSTARLKSDQFKTVLKTAAIFAREAAYTVKMQFGPTPEVIIAAVAEAVGDAEVRLPAEIDGEEAHMSFNVRYISDCLGVMNTDEVEFTLSGALLPGLIRAVDDDSYRYIIMPLKTT